MTINLSSSATAPEDKHDSILSKLTGDAADAAEAANATPSGDGDIALPENGEVALLPGMLAKSAPVSNAVEVMVICCVGVGEASMEGDVRI